MNLRDLQYLITVADSGQFARAAKQCNVSQPSLSMQLKKLEDELGVTVFERSGRQLIITQAGKAIIERARSVLKEVSEMRAVAQHYSGDAQEFRLGIIPTIAPYLLPQLLPQIRKVLPKLKLQLVETQTHVLEDMLAKGTVDAVIASLPVGGPELSHAVLYHEPCFVAVPVGHALAKKKKLTSAMLEGERIMLLDEGHCLRNQTLSMCTQAGMQENVDFRSTSLETLRHMVASGEGITLMPARAVRQDAKIAYIPCTEKGFTRNVALVWRRSTPFMQIIGQLKDLAATLNP